MMIRNDMSNAEYHGDLTHLSSSNLKLLLKGPEGIQQFYEERILKIQKEKKSTDAFDTGSYIHSVLLEPETVETDYAIFPEWVKRGKLWEEFKAANEGKIILSKPQKKKIDAMIPYYLDNKTAVELIKGVKPEISLFTAIDDVSVKVRADGLNETEGYIVDIKTSGFEIDHEEFKATLDKFHYKLSAALYLKAFEEALGKELDFYFVVLGKTHLGCEVYKLSNKSRLEGMGQVRKAIKIYKKCLETGDWTGEEDIKKLERENYEILEV